MINIRKYKVEDLTMLQSWYSAIGWTLKETSLPKDTTFVLEVDNIPVLSGCLFLMNCEDACMIENFIGNPEHKELRKDKLPILLKHLEQEAKKAGYKTVVLFSFEDKLKKLYENLGFTKTLDNVTTFAKEI